MDINIKLSIDGIYEIAEAVALLGSAIGAKKNMTNTLKALDEITEKAKSKKEDEITPQKLKEIKVEEEIPVVPTTTKEYTIDELSRAGAMLMDMGLMGKLVEILNSFGVAALTDLPKTKYGEFAMKMRELGADI